MELSKEAREAKNAYQRKWAHANPDKIRRYTRDHWEKKARDAQEKQKD